MISTWHQDRVRGGCRYLHPPLTVPTHRYSLFCTCFMTKCLSASVQHPGVPTHKQAHPCSLCTPHSLPSVALPSSPAHREKSAGSASPKSDMSCKHPKAAYFGIGSQTHGGGGGRNPPPQPMTQTFQSPKGTFIRLLLMNPLPNPYQSGLYWRPCPALV